MSSAKGLMAVVFDNPYKAAQARAVLHRIQGEELREIIETAIIVRGQDGKAHVSQDANIPVKHQKIGHAAGLIAAAVAGGFPIILASTPVGRLIGRLKDNEITNSFVKDVGKGLQPGTSAIVLLGRSGSDPRQKILGRLQTWNPTIVKSDLPQDIECEIESALESGVAVG
jgi:uncharacterized membrane protein